MRGDVTVEAEVSVMWIVALKMEAKEYGQSLEAEIVKEQILSKSLWKECKRANPLSLGILTIRTVMSEFVLFKSLISW